MPIPSWSLSHHQNSYSWVRYSLRRCHTWKCIIIKCVTNKNALFQSRLYKFQCNSLNGPSHYHLPQWDYSYHLFSAYYGSASVLRSYHFFISTSSYQWLHEASLSPLVGMLESPWQLHKLLLTVLWPQRLWFYWSGHSLGLGISKRSLYGDKNGLKLIVMMVVQYWID